MKHGPIYQAIKSRKITLFIAALLVIFGVYSFYITPKQESPDLTAPIAIITNVYPGASPEDVEEQVTGKIEDKAVEIDGYESIQSISKDSFAVVILRLENGMDVDKAWNELRRKMEGLKPDLPKECQDIQINTDVVETAGMIISMSGENFSFEELAAYAEELKKELTKIDGVSRFDVSGKQEKQVSVNVDMNKLNYFNLSLDNIAQIISAQNIDIPSGKVDDGNTKINVKIPGTYSSLEEIQNTVIAMSPANGSSVRIKDVAEVLIELEDSNYRIKHNGKNAVLLTGYFKSNKNIVIIGKEVEKAVDKFKNELPGGVTFDQVLYQPRDVSTAIGDFILNLIEGMIFVMIVVFAGMGLRNAVVVSIVIPLVVLITFSAMSVLGVKIHQISIAALIVALGMLVDNAIVVSDAIQVRLDSGQDKMGACVDGVNEVALPILTSTLTTVGAFIPLLLLPSLAGEYIRSLPLIIIISLSASYLVALFVTPTLGFMMFEKSRKVEKVSRVRQFFRSTLETAMEKKWGALIIISAAFVLSLVLATRLGLQFFPKADKNIIYIDINTEQSNDISKTEAITLQAAHILKKQSEITSYTAAVGDGLPKFFTTLPIYTQSQDFAQIMCRVDLKKGNRFKTNTELVDYLQEALDSSITGGTAAVKELEQGEPIGSPVRVRIAGENIERLKEVAEEIKNKLAGIQGTVNIEDDFQNWAYEFNVDIDVAKACRYGISKYDVQKDVNAVLSGRQTSVFRNGGNDYNIVVKGNIISKEELGNIGIMSSITGNKVILKEIAGIDLKSYVPTIKKYDRDRTIMVFSDVRAGYSSVKIDQQLKSKLKDMDIDDVNIEFDGEKAKIVQYFGDMGILAIFAALMIFGILLIEFSSFAQAFIILLTIPLSVIGSIAGLFISKQPLSFTSLMGIISLMGIVVNNAIVLLDYINTERKQGMDLEEACVSASSKRFRPIMLTTITTVVGLIPLVLSGNPLFVPMSIALLSGLSVSTLLTLIVIPVVYAVIEKRMHSQDKYISIVSPCSNDNRSKTD